MSNPESTGTPTPAAAEGDASRTTDEVKDGGGADKVDWEARARDLERKFEQQLKEKTNLEAERIRRQELEQENLRLRQGYGTVPATAVDPAAESALEMQQTFYALKGSQNPVDRLVAAQIEQTAAMMAQQRFTTELATIPASEQSEVMERARKDGVSPVIARQAIKAEKYDREMAELEARRKRLDEEEEARKRGRVDTTTTPIAARDFDNAKYTLSAYTRDCSLAERGDRSAKQRLDDFERRNVPLQPD